MDSMVQSTLRLIHHNPSTKTPKSPHPGKNVLDNRNVPSLPPRNIETVVGRIDTCIKEILPKTHLRSQTCLAARTRFPTRLAQSINQSQAEMGTTVMEQSFNACLERRA
jgi:hypothetical protein